MGAPQHSATGDLEAQPQATVVLLSSVHWHFTWQHHQTLAAELMERGYRVIWVEPLPKRWPGLSEWRRLFGRVRGNLRTAGGVEQRIPPGLVILNPRLVPETGAVSSWINRRFLLKRLERAVRSHMRRPLILLHYLPLKTAIELHRRLKPEFSAYGRFSEWPEDPFVSQRAIREDELCQQVDVILTESPKRAERVHELGIPMEFVPPVVDFDTFSAAARSGVGERSPLCAYFGLISDRLDLDLILRVASRYRVRLIGPRRGDLSRLENENIELLDPVPQTELPELLRPADVLLLPYAESPFHEGLLPAKTFECLATGKPVVASGLPALAAYGSLIYNCSGAANVLRTVERALEEPPEKSAERLEFARSHGLDVWVSRIESIWKAKISNGQTGPHFVAADSSAES